MNIWVERFFIWILGFFSPAGRKKKFWINNERKRKEKPKTPANEMNFMQSHSDITSNDIVEAVVD